MCIESSFNVELLAERTLDQFLLKKTSVALAYPYEHFNVSLAMVVSVVTHGQL